MVQDVYVVEFWCMKSTVGGTLQTVTFGTFAVRWPSFLQMDLFMLNSSIRLLYYWDFLLIVTKFFMDSFVTSAYIKTESCNFPHVKFWSVVLRFLFPGTFLNKVTIHCKLLFYSYLPYIICINIPKECLVGVRNWNIHNRSSTVYFLNYHIMFFVHPLSCSIHCETVFEILRTHRIWHSGTHSNAIYNGECDCYSPNGRVYWTM